MTHEIFILYNHINPYKDLLRSIFLLIHRCFSYSQLDDIIPNSTVLKNLLEANSSDNTVKHIVDSVTEFWE